MYVEDDGHTAPIEKEIRALSAALEAVKDEQEYIVTRERLHRDSELLFFLLLDFLGVETHGTDDDDFFAQPNSTQTNPLLVLQYSRGKYE